MMDCVILPRVCLRVLTYPKGQVIKSVMAISTNQKPTIYRNLYENTGPGLGLRLAVMYCLLAVVKA